ncbi:unnamed protein product [Prorocentrum cordatum]|uniref:Uncharacterized protein n=1 Tax=Prorocentrum cordatum TaxID=2364126 RepID=A0ABN9WJL6_9DINO|nr:unnamed protein product [Polarella glacialis]
MAVSTRGSHRSPERWCESEEELPWARVTPQHSHSVLKRLVSAGAAEGLRQSEALEAQLAPGAPEDPAQVLAQPPEPQRRAPAGLVGVCTGAPIYDGPTMGWEDCRARCVGHCRFWSYWGDSVQHRCKLTVDCDRRGRDGRHSVSAHQRVLDAAGEQADWSGETPPLDSEPQEEAVQEIVQQVAAPEADQTACSPRGSARKFVASPQSGWHNLGRARSYASSKGCPVETAAAGGPRATIAAKLKTWTVGPVASSLFDYANWHITKHVLVKARRGRCYGFASDVPEALERSCEDTYCWLFGLACQDQGLGAEAALAGGSDPLEAEAEVVTAKQHGIDDSIDVGHIVSAEVEKKPDELKSAQALAPEEKNGHMKEIARRIQHFFQGATRRFRAPRAGAENSRANDSGPVQAQPQAAQQVGHAAPEVEIGKARDSDSAEAGSKTVQHANLGLVGRKEAGTAEARFSDPFDGEPQTPKDDKKVVTAEAGETDIMDYERELRGVRDEHQLAARARRGTSTPRHHGSAQVGGRAHGGPGGGGGRGGRRGRTARGVALIAALRALEGQASHAPTRAPSRRRRSRRPCCAECPGGSRGGGPAACPPCLGGASGRPVARSPHPQRRRYVGGPRPRRARAGEGAPAAPLAGRIVARRRARTAGIRELGADEHEPHDGRARHGATVGRGTRLVHAGDPDELAGRARADLAPRRRQHQGCAPADVQRRRRRGRQREGGARASICSADGVWRRQRPSQRRQHAHEPAFVVFERATAPLWGTAAPAAAPLPEVNPAAPAAGAGGAERANAPAGPALQTWLSASGLGASRDIAARLRAAAPDVYED